MNNHHAEGFIIPADTAKIVRYDQMTTPGTMETVFDRLLDQTFSYAHFEAFVME